MAEKYVPIFYDWIEATQEFNDQEKGRLIDAIVLYARGEDWQDRIKGNERYAFPVFRLQVDRAKNISSIRAAARTNDNKTEQNESNFPKEKDKYKDKEKENNKENKRFAPPSLEEVSEYCKERNNGIDAQHFIDFYASKGWKVGNQTMKDWKACVRTWEQRNRSSPKKVIAQDFPQRDYSKVEDEMMASLAKEMAEFKAQQAI